MQEVVFLGHVVFNQGITMDTTKIEIVLKCCTLDHPPPSSNEFFLGLAGYYKRFVQDVSKILTALTELTKKGRPFVWTPKCEQSFLELRKRLVRLYLQCLMD